MDRLLNHDVAENKNNVRILVTFSDREDIGPRKNA